MKLIKSIKFSACIKKLSVLSFVLLACSSVSLAQTGDTSNGLVLEEIIVTASKREQSLKDVGLSVAALSSDSIKKRGINSVEDLVKVIPSFYATATPLGSPVYSIRGVGFYNDAMAGVPAVTVYVDEVPLPYPIMASGVSMDLERVEVLKGPQGTLFGQNSTGGAVNYIAAKPTDEFAAGVDVSVGRFNAIKTSGFVSGPLSDTVKARIAVTADQSDGWQENYTRDESQGDRDFMAMRALVDWTPNDRVSSKFAVSAWDDQSQVLAGQYVLLNAQRPDLASAQLLSYPTSPEGDIRAADWSPGTDWARDNQFVQVSNRTDYEINDNLTLTSITAYSDYDRDDLVDTDGTSLSIVDRAPSGWIKAFSQELRVANNASNQVRWVAGFNYNSDESEERVFSDFSDASPATATGFATESITLLSEQEYESIGVFGNVEYDAAEAVTLKLGARYTDSSRDLNTCSADSGDGLLGTAFGNLWSFFSGTAVVIPPGGCITLRQPDTFTDPGFVQRSLDEENVAWTAGIDWRASEDQLIYFNISKGYKAGAFPTVTATTAVQTLPVEQESVLSYEAGLKSSYLDNRVSLDASVYYYDYKDKQILGRVAVPVFVALNALVNIPESTVFGQEIAIDAILFEGFTVGLSLANIDAEIDEYVGFGDLGTIEDFGGTAMPFSPETQASAGFEYRTTVSDSLEFFVGADARYQDSTYALPGENPIYEIDSYTTVDFRAGVAANDGKWSVMAWGKNVGDEYYATNVQRQTDSVIRLVGAPATYGITLNLKFGE